MEKTAIVMLAEGFEEMETVAPVDLLRRAGVSVSLVATGSDLAVRGRNGMVLQADCLWDARPTRADLVVVPGGPAFQALMADARVLGLLRQQAGAEGWIASICAGPMVLNAAELLQGRAFTCHYSVTTDALPSGRLAEPVVVDGKLITSQGAGTATAFALALVEALCGDQTAARIAAEICFSEIL